MNPELKNKNRAVLLVIVGLAAVLYMLTIFKLKGQ
jgi:hypothetical protein